MVAATVAWENLDVKVAGEYSLYSWHLLDALHSMSLDSESLEGK